MMLFLVLIYSSKAHRHISLVPLIHNNLNKLMFLLKLIYLCPQMKTVKEEGDKKGSMEEILKIYQDMNIGDWKCMVF